MPTYIPPHLDWVRDHIELYEGSNGTKGTTLPKTDMPCIIVTHAGKQPDTVRKIPLMRVKIDDTYLLIGSYGGAPKHPAWVFNVRRDNTLTVRDATEVFEMRAREVTDETERAALWPQAVAVFPPYAEYEQKTSRKIPVFVAEPIA